MDVCVSMVDDLCRPFAGHYMQRPNSSSYSRNMLATHEPDSSGIAKFGV